jgi:prolipoprotein diacylglyceryltransferase
MADKSSEVDRVVRQNRRAFGIAVPGAVVGICIAYPVLIWAKLSENLPDHLTWPYVFVGPLAFYGLLLGPMWLFSRWDLSSARRRDEAA